VGSLPLVLDQIAFLPTIQIIVAGFDKVGPANPYLLCSAAARARGQAPA
jgi:hypothetical protein